MTIEIKYEGPNRKIPHSARHVSLPRRKYSIMTPEKGEKRKRSLNRLDEMGSCSSNSESIKNVEHTTGQPDFEKRKWNRKNGSPIITGLLKKEK
jgi:hypothetical protein